MTHPEQEALTYWDLWRKAVYILVMCGPFALFALLFVDGATASLTLLSAYAVGTVSWVDGYAEAKEVGTT